MGNGLVNLINGSLELFAGEAIIEAERILKGFQLALKIGHINALAACDCKLALVIDGLLGCVHQKGHQYCVFATLGVAVGIKLPEEVLVFVLGGHTELKYRNIDPDVNLILNDIRETSLCLSTYGKEGNGNYEALVDGVSRIHSFTYMERYLLEAAIVDASKAAFLATMIEKGLYDYRKYDPTLPGFADMRLDDTVPVRLNRLRRNIPEAYYYWVLTSGLLK